MEQCRGAPTALGGSSAEKDPGGERAGYEPAAGLAWLAPDIGKAADASDDCSA